MLVSALIWGVKLFILVVQFTIGVLFRVLGKKRVFRTLWKFVSDPRVESAAVDIGQGLALSQVRSMFAQVTMSLETEIPEPPQETVTLGEVVTPETDGPPLRARWPEELDRPPRPEAIREICIEVQHATAEQFADWRFESAEAFRLAGVMPFILDGNRVWAEDARRRGYPEEIVKTSFTGGAMMTAFQLGLLCAQYREEA